MWRILSFIEYVAQHINLEGVATTDFGFEPAKIDAYVHVSLADAQQDKFGWPPRECATLTLLPSL